MTFKELMEGEEVSNLIKNKSIFSIFVFIREELVWAGKTKIEEYWITVSSNVAELSGRTVGCGCCSDELKDCEVLKYKINVLEE